LRLIKEIVAEINLRLAPYKISKTTYENQDNFAINSEYAIVFEAILTEGYRRFYKSGFLLQYFNHIPDLKAKEREKIPNKINAKNPVL
jgi:hypothetical protein